MKKNEEHKTYQAVGTCPNCGLVDRFEIPYKTRFYEFECPRCGCAGINKIQAEHGSWIKVTLI